MPSEQESTYNKVLFDILFMVLAAYIIKQLLLVFPSNEFFSESNPEL